MTRDNWNIKTLTYIRREIREWLAIFRLMDDGQKEEIVAGVMAEMEEEVAAMSEAEVAREHALSSLLSRANGITTNLLCEAEMSSQRHTLSD